MSSLSFDAQSLVIDGRRTWLVSGTIDFATLPRDQWAGRIRDAKRAGLNCIATRVFWNLHEPSPGRPRFDGDLDLRHFVELVGRQGLYCILRVGPYVGGGADNGGLPAWLHNVPGIRLRQSHPRFLEATARWFAVLMQQVADLQVTSAAPPFNGTVRPIVLMQVEHEWRCHHPAEAQAYLGELMRYLREEDCQVPLIETNECWQQVEGLFSTWIGAEDLAVHMRQFRAVQQLPRAQTFPLMVSEFRTTAVSDGTESAASADASTAQLFRLAQVLATGAQFNLEPFVGGAMPALLGGRSTAGEHATTIAPPDAPVSATGAQGAGFAGVRRIATFASQFGHVLAALDPAAAQVIGALDNPRGVSVVHHRGSQGDLVFLFRGSREDATATNIVLADGRVLPVPLGDEPVAWLLLNVNLHGNAQLQYTNLRPWATMDRLLVFFGPAGAAGQICLDGAELNITVPTGPAPHVTVVDEVVIVVLSTEQVDAAWLSAAGLVVGASGLDENDQPLPHPKFKRATLVRPGGETETVKFPAPRKRAPLPRLSSWEMASETEMIRGTSDRFQPLAGPASLESQGAEGCGWYRLQLKSRPAGLLMAPDWRGRVQLYSGGRGCGALDDGGATPFSLRSSRELVALAVNSGRFSEGWRIGETMGLNGPLYAVKRRTLKPPRLVRNERTPDPTELAKFLTDFSFSDRLPCDAFVWQARAGRGGLIVQLNGFPHRAMLLARGKRVGLYDPQHSAGRATFTLRLGEHVRAGSNELRLALFERLEKPVDPRRFVSLYEIAADVTEQASWSFAPWTAPAVEQFHALKRGRGGSPAWFRFAFATPDAASPMVLSLAGVTRGQVFLNGRHVSRYDLTSPRGKKDGAPQRVLLSASWLRSEGANELVLFDESGAPPTRCQLMHAD